MKIDLHSLTIKKAHEHMKVGDFTVKELVNEYLGNISKNNENINAYLEVFSDIDEQIEIAQKKFSEGSDSVMTGIPVAIKDNILINGKIASASSKMLENYHATYDATVIAKLKEAGAILMGRTNMDEFAMGGSTENSAYGVTKNPHDDTRVAGGSSGGGAAAVAMNGALVSLGSDTGGSIRQPASFCGIVGLKPTYGSVSRHGLMAMGSSLDQIGPMTKNIEDAEILFNFIKGHDPMDSGTLKEDTYKKIAKSGFLKIGIPKSLLQSEGIDKDILNNFNLTVEKLKSKGYEIIDIDLPHSSYALAVYYILMPAEVSSNMARFDGIKYGLHKDGKNLLEDYLLSRREGFGKEVRRRILLGTYVLSAGYQDAYYNKANAVRKILVEDFNKAFKHVDVIMTPTTPSPAFKIGEKSQDPLSMYLEDIFTVTANLTGMPAISVPSGYVKKEDKNLPLGIQFTAPHGQEDFLFEVGKSIEHDSNSTNKQ